MAAKDEWPKKVKLTIRPDEDVEVDQREYENLDGQGLIQHSKTESAKSSEGSKS